MALRTNYDELCDKFQTFFLRIQTNIAKLKLKKLAINNLKIS